MGGLTLLSFAALNGHLEAVKFLIKEAGADIESKGMWEQMPLGLAAVNGHLDIVNHLVEEAWADIESKDSCRDGRR